MTLLGQRLFFDTRLSQTGSKSCATCHNPHLAFTDGYRRSSGIYADETVHNAPSLLHLNSYHSLNWADSTLTMLSEQMKRPLFGTSPIELGMSPTDTVRLHLLSQDTVYRQLLDGRKLTWSLTLEALASYVEQLNGRHSPFDQRVLSEAAREGYRLFQDKKCDGCHGGRDFNRPPTASDNGFRDIGYGRVRIPSLRNVSITAPYMHDGHIDDILNAVDHAESPLLSSEKVALVAFLYRLTDTGYLQKPFFRDPW
jgi:cytochrome c peroxidase